MKLKMFVILDFVLIITGCIMLGGNNTGIDDSAKVYEGSALGFRGPISLLVHFNGNEITQITVVDSQEDVFVGAQAIDELIDLVIMYNTTEIDAISGATESSRGFLDAVLNAIMKK